MFGDAGVYTHLWTPRLGGMSVFDVNKITTCITLMATEALDSQEIIATKPPVGE